MVPTEETLRILLVDDDAELCDLVGQYFRGRGFGVEIEGDGENGLARAQSGEHDLLILDVMLPGMNGFEVLRQLRAGSNNSLPVIMLTAHGDEIDRIVGLELGADDYLPKPFNPRELLARMRAVLRRGADKTSSNPSPHTGAEEINGEVPRTDEYFSAGTLTMDLGAHSVQQAGEPIPLTVTEFDLLRVLLKNAGRVVNREDLSHQALGRRLLPFDRSLDLHMSKLRRKLGPKSDGGERIKTLRSVGFLLERDDPQSGDPQPGAPLSGAPQSHGTSQ
jgi:two-component system response regulator CpxR